MATAEWTIDTFWERLSHLFWPRVRAVTAKEAELLNEIERLKAALAAVDQEIAILKTDLSMRESEIQIHELEIKKLNDVCERDRLRIAAESANYARHVEPPQPGLRGIA